VLSSRDNSLLGETHISSEGAVWDPLGGVAWVGLFEHAVDLLQGKTLGLWDQEVGVDEADKAERSPNEEDLGSEVGLVLVHHVWSDDGNDLLQCQQDVPF
jgi:hypothetical protein